MVYRSKRWNGAIGKKYMVPPLLKAVLLELFLELVPSGLVLFFADNQNAGSAHFAVQNFNIMRFGGKNML